MQKKREGVESFWHRRTLSKALGRSHSQIVTEKRFKQAKLLEGLERMTLKNEVQMIRRLFRSFLIFFLIIFKLFHPCQIWDQNFLLKNLQLGKKN